MPLKDLFWFDFEAESTQILHNQLKYADAKLEALMPELTKKAAKIFADELIKEIDAQDLILSGDMKASVAVTVMDQMELDGYEYGHKAIVVPFYAHLLETGTSRMKPFKFATKAWNKALPKIRSLVNATMMSYSASVNKRFFKGW